MTDRIVFDVRPFQKRDIPQLFKLMEALGIFEGCIHQFAVTEQALEEFGLGDTPRFGAHVAVDGRGCLIGMAVHYVLPWTLDLRPTLVLKELYVSKAGRGCGAGLALVRAVALEARRIGASQIRWTVLNGNLFAQKFQSAFGGRPDRDRQSWFLDEAALLSLAAEADEATYAAPF